MCTTNHNEELVDKDTSNPEKIQILQDFYKQLWNEIMYRRGVEDKTVVWITGIMFLIAGGILTHPISSISIKILLAIGITVICTICIRFIWRNHKAHNDVAKIIVKMASLFGLFKKDIYCKDALYPDKFQDFGKAKWGTQFRISLMTIVSLVCIILVFTAPPIKAQKDGNKNTANYVKGQENVVEK